MINIPAGSLIPDGERHAVADIQLDGHVSVLRILHVKHEWPGPFPVLPSVVGENRRTARNVVLDHREDRKIESLPSIQKQEVDLSVDDLQRLSGVSDTNIDETLKARLFQILRDATALLRIEFGRDYLAMTIVSKRSAQI